jgi:uncharacterized protein YyaL (SSP411 family)
MIAALADAGAVLQEPRYLDAATACAEFVLSELRDGDGHLLRTWKDGRGRIAGYLEDHAYMLEALLVLYEATFEPRWYAEAVALAGQLETRFADPERGGFFTTAVDHEQLLVRRKDLEDSPTPSGSSSAAYGLLRLAALSGEASYERAAVGVLRLMMPIAVKHPGAFGHLLRAADFYLAPVKEVAIVGAGTEADAMLRAVRAELRPHLVLAATADRSDHGIPLLAERLAAADGGTAAYVCENFACRAPVHDADALAAML